MPCAGHLRGEAGDRALPDVPMGGDHSGDDATAPSLDGLEAGGGGGQVAADGDDPAPPVLPIGVPDWDNPRSWRANAAAHALVERCQNGEVDQPADDIGLSRAVGHSTVTAEPGQMILAEGIFAAEIIAALSTADALAAAYCIHNSRWLTFWLRLVRDLAERHKPPWILLRRGLALFARGPPHLTRAVPPAA